MAAVEKILAPHGLTVSTNERVFNEEGVQIAEFDVEVSGRFGSADIRWLIECRDRPGQGSAPCSWIEQLVGRRARFGFNKVTAVSTTGFAPGAVDFAKLQQIELREVASLSPDGFIPWLTMRTMGQQRMSSAVLRGARIVVDSSEPADRIHALESLLANTAPDAPILRSTKTGECVPLANAFLSAVQAVGNMFDDVVENGLTKHVDLNVDYSSDDDHFAVDTDAGAVRVRSIAYVGDLQIKFTRVPMLKVAEYRRLDSGTPISQVVSFEPQEIHGIKSSLELHRIAETGEIRLHFQRPPGCD